MSQVTLAEAASPLAEKEKIASPTVEKEAPVHRTLIPDDQEVQGFIADMRKDSELQALSVERLQDLEIYKFFIGHHKNRETARTRIMETLKWRVEFDFYSIVDEDFSYFERSGKMYRLPWRARSGHTVIVWRSRLHVPDPPRQEKLVRWFIRELYVNWLLGEATDKVILVIDRQGAEGKHRDLGMTTQVATLFGAHFPECLHQIYVFPTGWITTMLWNMVCPFLDAATVAKVQLVDLPTMKSVMHNLLPEYQIPPSLGGNWKDEPAGIDPEVLLAADS